MQDDSGHLLEMYDTDGCTTSFAKYCKSGEAIKEAYAFKIFTAILLLCRFAAFISK
jgi:hypothetical protein